MLGALFFLIGHGTLHWAEQYVGSGLAALLIATEPMFILVLAWTMGQQKISRLSALGLGLGVVGVALLTGAELNVKGSSLLGLLAVLVGSLSWSTGVAISPKTEAAERCTGTYRGAAGLWRSHAARRSWTDWRVSRDALGQHFSQVDSGIRLPDCLRIDRCVHCLHVAAADGARPRW